MGDEVPESIARIFDEIITEGAERAETAAEADPKAESAAEADGTAESKPERGLAQVTAEYDGLRQELERLRGNYSDWANKRHPEILKRLTELAAERLSYYDKPLFALDADEPEAVRQFNEVESRYKGTAQWLIEPNGKPTNLTEWQWVQVRTPLFKERFGDWEAVALRDRVDETALEIALTTKTAGDAETAYLALGE
jgi:hypothetical protein